MCAFGIAFCDNMLMIQKKKNDYEKRVICKELLLGVGVGGDDKISNYQAKKWSPTSVEPESENSR